ncbi:MAG: hypothetical protein NC120_09380 [Ruminococcus sp.]|nr:hypothetical protein [Ruminococcus sp.]
MDFFSVNSLNSYLNTMNMESRWEYRKNNKDYKADGAKTISEWAEEQKKELSESSYEKRKKAELENDRTYKNIVNKYSAGNKLTHTEIAYLRDKDPVMYQKAKMAQAEQNNYEKNLKKCKTKDDVRRLKLHHISSSLSAVNAVKNDPRISAEKKAEFISEERRKCDAIEKITVKFAQTSEYSKLPTDAEKRKAEKKKRDEFKSSIQGTKKCKQIVTENKTANDVRDRKKIQKDNNTYEKKASEYAENKKVTQLSDKKSENAEYAKNKQADKFKIKYSGKKPSRKAARKLNRKA